MKPANFRTLMRRFPGGKFSDSSGELAVNCPRCADKSFNLEIATIKMVFHCWRCHYKGHVDRLFRDLGLDFVQDQGTGTNEHKKRTVEVIERKPIEYTPFSANRSTLQAQMAYSFAKEKLHNRPPPLYWGTGDGKLKSRLVIPVLEGDEAISFQARAIRPWQQVKYVSGKPSDGFRSTSQCFYKVGGRSDRIHLVEGPFDAEVAASIVEGPAWALMGTNLSAWQRNHLAVNTNTAIIWLDPDDAGIKASLKIGRILMAAGLVVWIGRSTTDPKSASGRPVLERAR